MDLFLDVSFKCFETQEMWKVDRFVWSQESGLNGDVISNL